MGRVGPNAEPGTGTQIAAHASPPDVDDDLPCSMRINGTLWKVGHDYLDTEIGDVCGLVEIIGKSSWCDTRDASDCPPKLVFAYDRYEGLDGNRITIDPNTPDPEFGERFIERYTPPQQLGQPDPPW